jgi:DNA-binding beta-propeller fold protein YncE
MFTEGKAWFTAEGSKAIASYDPAQGKIDWCLGTGQDRTHMIYVQKGGKKIYTTNVASATVSILSDSLFQARPLPNGTLPPNAKPREDWVQNLIPVGKGTEGFDVSPDGKELWAAGSDDGIIYIINTQSQKLIDKLDGKVIGANRLKFTPDGKLVLVSSLRTGDLFIFNAINHQEIKHLSTGHGAAGILVDVDGSRAFIGCTGDNYVAVVDLKTFEITNHIPLAGADGLAWAIRP